LDLGTQSVRALAVTGVGDVLGVGSRPLTSYRDGPRHEQDPEQWWQGAAAASKQALRTVPASAIRGVAVDGTSGTVLLTDTDGHPLTAALMYDDTRVPSTTVNSRDGDRRGPQGGGTTHALPFSRMILPTRRDDLGREQQGAAHRLRPVAVGLEVVPVVRQA
jgi:D-ribulokinase